MAYLKSKTLFFTTSPRTPLKMIPEIEVLERYFEGKVWNPDTQVEYIKKLVKGKDFQGKGSKKEMSFSARDRINRAPKALGFVDLKPTIKITQPGRQFINGKRTEEILLPLISSVRQCGRTIILAMKIRLWCISGGCGKKLKKIPRSQSIF